jgi:hypothetical protein
MRDWLANESETELKTKSSMRPTALRSRERVLEQLLYSGVVLQKIHDHQRRFLDAC